MSNRGPLNDREIRFLSENKAYYGIPTIKLSGVQDLTKIERSRLSIEMLAYLSKEVVKDLFALNAGDSMECPEHSMHFYCEERPAEDPPLLVSPFLASSLKDVRVEVGYGKGPSRGLSSYGYDITLGNRFSLARPAAGIVYIDTVEPEMESITVDVPDGDFIVLNPGNLLLGHCLEKIHMPRDVVAVCMAKSTLARLGLRAEVTPIEPGWRGHITVELTNMTAYPIHVRPGIGIMQVMFMRGEPADVCYADRDGKYQDQPAEPVAPRF